MDILNKLLLKDLQEIAKVMEIEIGVGQKKDELKKIISNSLEENNTELAYGTLDTAPEGFGFLKETTLGKNIYMSASQIKRFKLRRGDQVLGEVRKPIGEEKNYAIRRVLKANDNDLASLESRIPYEELVPTYPTEQFKLGIEQDNISGRILDLISPIGKGQRALIIAPPKAGKTTFISSIANALIEGQKDSEVWILLIDERPEEVTDIKENVEGAMVFASTFDDDPKNHIKVTEEIIEKAKMKVEDGENVVILLDSLTRLARAYNIVMPSSGKLLSGGIDPTALYYPKNFFGAARNIKDGGSLTIIATALINTGSRMDDLIFEEFKGTGNMEIVLSPELASRRVFPAIDFLKSSTRKEDLLLSPDEVKILWQTRRKLEDVSEPTIGVLNHLRKHNNNKEYIAEMKKFIKE